MGHDTDTTAASSASALQELTGGTFDDRVSDGLTVVDC